MSCPFQKVFYHWKVIGTAAITTIHKGSEYIMLSFHFLVHFLLYSWGYSIPWSKSLIFITKLTCKSTSSFYCLLPTYIFIVSNSHGKCSSLLIHGEVSKCSLLFCSSRSLLSGQWWIFFLTLEVTLFYLGLKNSSLNWSSEYVDEWGEKAFDGDMVSHFRSNSERQPWLKGDLGNIHIIIGALFANRNSNPGKF